MTAAEREFDLVLYGATGFVGKLTAEYLARTGAGVRIALAGRSTDRLRAVRDTLGDGAADWPRLAAEASQPATLKAMAERARVVVTTVGPYAKYGLPLVEACAAAGTDYADLCGEAYFIRNTIDLFHKQAVDALYRKAVEDGTGEHREELGETTFVLRGFSGGFSGGTVASGVELFQTASTDPDVRRLLGDPYSLSTDRGAESD